MRRIPIFPTLGNHEANSGGAARFAELFPLGNNALFDGKVLAGQIEPGGQMAPVAFGDTTRGHRFLSKGEIKVWSLRSPKTNLPIPKEAFMSERVKKKNGLPNAIDEMLKAGLPVPDDAEAVAFGASGGH